MEIGRFREAIPLLQSALGLAPDDAHLHCRMALALLRMGDRKRALQEANLAIQADPTEESGHRLLSIILLESGNIAGTLKEALEAVSLDPQNIRALNHLTWAFLHAKLIDHAHRCAEQLRQIAPASFLAHEALALVALRRQRWREAEAHCRAGLAIDPLSYSAFNNLGVALKHTLRMQEAIEAFFQAAHLMPLEKIGQRNFKAALSDHLINPIGHALVFAAAMAVVLVSPPASANAADSVQAHYLATTGILVAVGFVALICWNRFRALSPPVQQWIRAKFFTRKTGEHGV